MRLLTHHHFCLVLACSFTMVLISTSVNASEEEVTGTATTTAIDLYETQQFKEAENIFNGLREQEGGPVPSYYLALINQKQGDLETAAEYMEEAAEQDPANSLYRQKLGEYYGTQAGNASVFKKMGLAKKSRASFEKAVELDGNNLDARSGLLTYYLQAPGIAGGSEEKALDQAREISRQNPARGHLAMAQVYQHQGELEAVESEYRAAIEADPEELDPWLGLGIFLTSQERYGDALKLYRERLSTQPDDMPITYQLGRTVSISGQSLEEGRAALTHYILVYQPTADDPGLDWAHYRLGLIYEKLGDNEAAGREYQAALDLNADHPEAGKALKKLK